jgi:hypothetical protein
MDWITPLRFYVQFDRYGQLPTRAPANFDSGELAVTRRQRCKAKATAVGVTATRLVEERLLSARRLKQVLANLLVQQYPAMTDEEIAKKIGLSRSTLHRDGAYQRAKKMSRQDARDRVRSGYRDSETGWIECGSPKKKRH